MNSGEASSSSTSQGSEYEVFLSFRGVDTRKGFTDHLYNRLCDAGIRTFRDNEGLHTGEEIEPELLEMIQQSKICIPIFSKNYASSKWCLIELTQMMKCKKDMGRLILPVFYDVSPEIVKDQSDSFKTAFLEHDNNVCKVTVQAWKEALEEVGHLKGLEKDKISDGPTHYSWNSWHGWYWKTTIAKFMYSQLTQHYRPYCSFIKVIREEATKTEGLVRLQNQLIRDILKDKKDLKDVETVPEGKKRIKEMLCDKKVLIVLDDVDEQSQLEAAAGGVSWFGSGSRIIVTTRDKAVLKARKVTWIYELKGMSEAHSLQLFSLHAFGETRPRADLYELSRDTVKTGGGLPLYMGVIGRLLKGHLDDKALWKSASIKLKSDPDRGVLGKLKISYDTLEDDAQRAIFLDIACHFIGDNRRYCVYMWDDCDLPGDYGVGVLVSRSLVKMGEGNKFRMHDVLRDLGRYIVRQEKEKPISRLWRCEDAEETLIDCKSILLERPRVISANVGHAWDLPPNTFGAAYAKFMGSRNFSPDDRPPVRFMESDELAYVAMRAREVHDFWHTLFNLPTNLIGESALKVIEFEQMFLPMCLMSVVGGTSRFSEKQRSMFFLHYFPWAAKAGVRCTNLMCIYYEKHFHEDLEDVRKRWGIEPLPLLRK